MYLVWKEHDGQGVAMPLFSEEEPAKQHTDIKKQSLSGLELLSSREILAECVERADSASTMRTLQLWK